MLAEEIIPWVEQNYRAAPERVLSLSLYSSFDRADPYLKLRYDLMVRIALGGIRRLVTRPIRGVVRRLRAFGAPRPGDDEPDEVG